MNWLPISTAPKDRENILVNDTNPGASLWAAAKWIEAPEWSGWAYDDEMLNDCRPLGPQPTHWLDVPEVPI